MSNSSVIAFAMLVGFVVYVTMRGELADYMGIIGVGAKANQ